MLNFFGLFLVKRGITTAIVLLFCLLQSWTSLGRLLVRKNFLSLLFLLCLILSGFCNCFGSCFFFASCLRVLHVRLNDILDALG